MFSAGIFLAWNLESITLHNVIVLITPLLLIASLAAHFLVKSFSGRWLTGLLIHLAFLFAGFWAAYSGMPERDKEHFSFKDQPEAYLVRITEPLSERRNAYRTMVEVHALLDSTEVIPATGKVLLYFRKPSANPLPDYGDYIVVSKHPVKVPPPLNPGQFDFRKHLARKGVHHQLFVHDDNWHSTGQSNRNVLFGLAYRTRDHLVKVMQDNGLQGDEFAVASAILLGYDELLSQELRKGYTGAGAMHVLCVSGLHVGIIFLIFSTMLRFLDRMRRGAVLRGTLLLMIIWFYAFITGLSPSVMRSAFMISFLLAGEMMNRKGQALNTLAAAAFLILVIDPAALFSIGFQLSFTAVAGILLFQQAIAGLLIFRSKVAAYFWEATSVALAAQLSTTPVVLFYFQQFPLYFWLSNLFLTPLSFLIISIGMLMLLLSPLPWLPYGLGLVTSALIYAMNGMILWVESLPMAVIKNLYISQIEFILLILLAILLALWIRKSSKSLVFPFLLLLVLVVSSFSLRHFNHLRQDGFLVYALPGRTAISLVHGKQHVLIADSTVLYDEGTIEFNMAKFWNSRAISQHEKVNIANSFQNDFVIKEGSYLVFSGQLMQLFDVSKPASGPEADIYLMHGKTAGRRLTLPSPEKRGLMLLDASLNSRTADGLSDFARKNGWDFFDIRANGAYIGGFWKQKIP